MVSWLSRRQKNPEGAKISETPSRERVQHRIPPLRQMESAQRRLDRLLALLNTGGDLGLVFTSGKDESKPI